jgi:High potential iron-sulfur protein
MKLVDSWQDAHSACRRRILMGITVAVFALLESPARARDDAPACSDPDNLSNSEQALRKSLDYVETSADAKKTCRGCSFFALEGQGPCGSCQIMNGTVNANGHCTSWNSKQ